MTAVQKSGNGGEMVRTKRTRTTQGSRPKAKRESGDIDSVKTTRIAGESLQEIQHCALARTFGDALFGDSNSMRLVAKQNDDTMSVNQTESSGNGFSQAAVWAAEPEWIGEASEETVDMMTGGREPE